MAKGTGASGKSDYAIRVPIFLAVMLPLSAGMSAASPPLPKPVAVTSITVLDLAGDLSARNAAAKEAYTAMVAIQGLVNRSSAAKIYFVHSPVEWKWNSSFDKLWLDSGLVPVPAKTAILDRSKSYPVLSYLLNNHAALIKGTVLTPNADAPADYDGAFAAAFTACGILDAIPVSSAINNYLADEGWKFPQLDDTRPLANNAMAFDWAYGKYFLPETGRQVIGVSSTHGYGHGWDSEFPAMLDYWIAARTFVYCLNPTDEQQKSRLPILLNSQNYPYATPIIGSFYGEGGDVEAAEDLGYATDISFMPNVSVLSSFPSDPKGIRRQIPKIPLPLDPNGAYVGFYVTDGDSWLYSSGYHLDLWARSPSKGKYPIGWSTNVQMFDVFPTLLAWYSQHDYEGKYELIANTWHVGRAGGPGYSPFIDRYRYYVENTRGLFRTVNFASWFPSYTKTQLQGIASGSGFEEYLEGYGGGPTNTVSWTVFGSERLIHTGLTGPTQGGASTNSIVTAITSNVQAAPAGKPVFMTVSIGDGNADCAAYVDKAVAQLLASPPQGRKFYWLRPSDVGAAWKYSVYGELPPLAAREAFTPRSTAHSDSIGGERFDLKGRRLIKTVDRLHRPSLEHR